MCMCPQTNYDEVIIVIVYCVEPIALPVGTPTLQYGDPPDDKTQQPQLNDTPLYVVFAGIT